MRKVWQRLRAPASPPPGTDRAHRTCLEYQVEDKLCEDMIWTCRQSPHLARFPEYVSLDDRIAWCIATWLDFEDADDRDETEFLRSSCRLTKSMGVCKRAAMTCLVGYGVPYSTESLRRFDVNQCVRNKMKELSEAESLL